MEKKFLFLILAFFIVPSVFAVSIDIKQNYQPRETLISKISGNFLESIEPENIFFYSGRLLVPMEYDIKKMGNSFYLYAILPNKERNYTLLLKGAHYFEAGQDKRQDFRLNFSVSGSIADFTIKPGLIISDKDFSITAESNNNDTEVSVSYSTFSSKTQVSAGTSEKILIPLMPSEEISFVELKSSSMSYKVPVKSLAKVSAKKLISFSKSFYNFTLFRGSETSHKLYIINEGTEEIKDIKITLSKELALEPLNISSIKPGSFAELSLALIPSEEETIKLLASAEGASANAIIQINLIIIPVENLTQEEIPEHLCRELGDICSENEVCTTREIETLDTPHCCGGVNSCHKKTSFFTIFIIILIIAAVGFAVYYFLKMRKKIIPRALRESAIGKLIETRGSLSKT